MAKYETNCEEFMNDLIALKKSAIDNNVSDLNKSQITVQSMDSDKTVIHFNLNEESMTESSKCDETGGKRFPDNSSDKSNRNTQSERKSQSDANDNNMSENNPFDETIDSLTKSSRSSRRTISESTDEDSKKGILKYSRNWVRRTVSESHCDSVDLDLDLLSVFWHSVEDVYSDDDLSYERKPKKNVRFSENISKTIFRPNSSILGRKLKNKKKSQKAKNRKTSNRKTNSETNLETEGTDSKVESERTRQDSGYDSEDNVLQIETKGSVEAIHKSIGRFEVETGIEKLLLN